MLATPPAPDGSVEIEHNGHHFHLMATDCAYATLPDGGANPALLQTPEMTCTVCGQIVQAFVPLLGDHAAQLSHAYFRMVLGQAADLPSGIAAVIADIQAAGGTVRIAINDRT